jgi:lipooligosaccharide transport system permease protein
MNAAKIVQRNSLVYWRAWRSSLFLSVLTPVLFLSAMGLGLGTLIEQGGAETFGGAGYLPFFSTGMLAATCMQSGAFSATYPLMNKIVWRKSYDAMLATPLRVTDLFLGELGWIGIMLSLQAALFFLVMTTFGIPESPLAIFAVPSAVLLGLAFSSLTMAWTATLENDEPYNWLFRFVITPLFLLSGTFFPIDSLPGWAVAIANVTPLYHGIELVRQVTIYDVAGETVWHLAYLMVLLGLGIAIGIRAFTRRLVA